MKDEITDEIIGLIESENVVGLATHRHYPREKMIYSRFGRCGFAIDVVRMEDGVRKTYSVLVEAEASDSVKDIQSLPGKISYYLVVSWEGNVSRSVKTGNYRDAADLFSRVEKVRQAFYKVYRRLKEERREEIARIGEEVFHAVGLTADELHLGV